MNQKIEYTFGDDDLATARLELLARVFEPTTRVFLCRALGFTRARPARVLDVGAGPGASSDLLAEVIQPRALLALDNSARYVELARRRPRALRAVDFRAEEADLNTGITEVGMHDFVYCRHVLAHLRDVPNALLHLRAAVAPGGVLALEETARLHSEEPILARYYALVEALQATRGQRTFVGDELAGRAQELGMDVRLALRTHTLVDPAAMAELHSANLVKLRNDEFTRSRYEARELDELAVGLRAIADGRPVPPVEVSLGQVVCVC